MLISEAFNAYRQNVIAFKGQSHKTEENHLIAQRCLINFVGDIDISLLTFEMVRQWKHELDQKRCPETVRNYIIKLRVVLAYLKVIKVEALDPAAVAVPKRTDKIPPFLSAEQVAILIDSTNKLKNKCIVSMLYSAGLRISELCAMDRGQIHEKTFTVVGKGGKARLCFIDDRTDTLLRLYLQERTDNERALFLNDAGTRLLPRTVQETFKTIRKRSGIDCHPHSLRHSFATNLLRSNTNLYYVSRFLGHSSLETTKQYLHVVDYDLEKIYREHHTI